eukprot:SAG25_NODE_5187_length_691_cov_2.224662_1_plen_89_part_00
MGPGGDGDSAVNRKYKWGVATRAACQAGCDAAAACVGYDYQGGTCHVYGPGVDTDLAGGWLAVTHPTTTIAGASGSSGAVCAAVAGRN